MVHRIIGLLIAIGALSAVYFFEGGAGGFHVFHWPAMVLTGVGPIGLVLLCSEWSAVKEAAGSTLRDAPAKIRRRNDLELGALQSLAQSYYSQGTAVFAQPRDQALSASVKRIVSRLALGISASDARAMADRDQERASGALDRVVSVASLGTRLSPSMGMLGTILGMVRLLAAMKDPSQIGAQMSLALMTTFYGLFFSLLVWTPIQHKLVAVREARLDSCEQLAHWLDLVEKRKPARYLSDAFGPDAAGPNGSGVNA